MGKTKTDKQPKKAAVAKKMKPVKTKLTKSQVFDALAEDSGMAKSEVKKLWGSLERLIEASICDEGYGQFTLPGLMKVTTVRRPAIKARRGINPFTKEETWFKAKPASTGVRIRALKKMKGFANDLRLRAAISERMALFHSRSQGGKLNVHALRIFH